MFSICSDHDGRMNAPPSAPVIGDLLVTGDRLEVWCQNLGCSRTEITVWMPEEAVARLGAHTTFADARRILVCPACKAAGRQKMIGARASVLDYYGRQERERLAQYEAQYGPEAADLLKAHLRRPGR
ncbi:hypothetical protein DMC25_27040 [Caulobacter sp. D4A]|nr:hypothetical protein DMC25_27040 [Caulobacter sp. D4A]PXA96819.1 hypothetical protein DMC18_00725 [Caulobacter sp. D5]